jgi:hypothetical protein
MQHSRCSPGFPRYTSRLHRKNLDVEAIFCCLIGITTGSAVFAQDSTNKAAGGAVVAFLYLSLPAYNFGINDNLGLYIAETHPFHLRMRRPGLFSILFYVFHAARHICLPRWT